MHANTWSTALAEAQAKLQTTLTQKGPRAYADTHDTAMAILDGHARQFDRATREEGGRCPASKLRALDLGAGRGELSERLFGAGYEVTAVERYTAQFTAQVPLIDADLNQRFPFDDQSYDVVMAVEVLEHLENPRGFLREIARVLRPGGTAVVSTPNLTSWLSRALFTACGQWDLFFNHPWRLRDPYSDLVHGHITPIPKWLLAHHARDAGLDVTVHRYSAAYLPGVPWRVNPLPRGAAFGRILLTGLQKPMSEHDLRQCAPPAVG